jgi:pimeloyl-ACP methyl ester carboxylesterase
LSILFLLLGLLFAVIAAAVLLTNLFAWYEAANRHPELLDRRSLRQMLSAMRPAATEMFLLFVTVLLRPLGWSGSGAVRCRQGGLLPGTTPVLLLHGLFHNCGCWWWIRRRLRSLGMPVFVLNLPMWTCNIERGAAMVARMVDELRIAHGVEKVHLIGHSMGGLVARYYLQNGGAGKVDRCILLGAPNGGSKLAVLAVSPMGRNLLPGSPFLGKIDPRLPPGVRLIAISSRDDNLILPPENARLEGARNIELTGVQHTSLLYHPLAVASIASELREER